MILNWGAKTTSAMRRYTSRHLGHRPPPWCICPTVLDIDQFFATFKTSAMLFNAVMLALELKFAPSSKSNIQIKPSVVLLLRGGPSGPLGPNTFRLLFGLQE